jgi:UDP-N-acetylglucosamine 2-epimerase
MNIITVVGARPEFVKAAPVSRALAAHPEGLHEQLVHTGQHYDREMSDIFFTDLGLPGPIHLGVGSGPHGAQTGEMLTKLERLFSEHRPDAVMVYGDTNSTLAGALAAAKMHIPVTHVEAGLRSFNMAMPEEINRRVTDHISTLLLCPSPAPARQLESEGITSGVHIVGDVNFDAMLQNMPGDDLQAAVLHRFGVEPGRFGLVTVHRAENTDDPNRLHGILEGLRRVAAIGLPLVFPVHPRTWSLIEHALPDGIVPTRPIGFEAFVSLAKHAAVGFTDSGGVQKELFWLETPCVTLRDETEWTETVDAGWNRIVGADPDLIVEAFEKAATVAGTPPPVYGTGQAAEAVVAVLSDWSME